MVFNWNAVESGVITAVVTIFGGVVWLKQHLPQIKKDVLEIKEVVSHIKKNQPAVEAADDALQAATTDDKELRLSYIAAAVHLLPTAIGVELDNLKNVPAPVIAKLLNDRVPILRGSITANEVSAALRFGSLELSTLRNHELVPTIREILDCLDQKQEQQNQNTEVVADKQKLETETA